MQEPLALVSAAADFAARRHSGQTLKGRKRAPYVNHLAEVAALAASAPAGRDAEIVAAGWLHDAVEDGRATFAEVEDLAGPRVRRLVAELTDDMSLPDEERRRRQVAEVAGKSAEARLLKLCDKISKVREMAADPPADWPPRQVEAYVLWCLAVVDAGCRGLDAALEGEFDRAVERVRKEAAEQ